MLAVLAVLVAAVFAYAQETLFDSRVFASRAVSVLEDEAIQRELSATIADQAIAQSPDLVAVRPLVEGVAGLLVSSAALQALLASGIEDVHASVVNGSEETLLITLENVGVLIRQGLQAAAPDLAAGVSSSFDIPLFQGGDEDFEGIVIDASQIADGLEIGHWIALAFALAAALGSIAYAPTRLAGIRRLGRSLAVGAIAALVIWQLGRGIVALQFPDGDPRDTARAVYGALLGDLRTWLLVLAGSGLVITAGASSTRDPIDVGALVARIWGRVTSVPDNVPGKILRALILLLVGILALLNRDSVVDLAAFALGAIVIYAGAAELMRLAAGNVRSKQAEYSAARDAEEDLSRGGLLRVALVGAVLLAGFVLVGLGSDDDERPPAMVDTCNGHIELCDRTLDEVAFAGTHNSMSGATYDNWFFAQQEKGITEQLEAGIRALLVDPHYGVETPQGVATDLDKDLGSREKIEAGLGSEAVAAAEALRKQIGYEGGGDTEVFLCHGFCEVGTILWVEGLREVRDFLVLNPGEVVVVSIEDATTPQDTVAEIEAAGLGDLIYTGPNGPWPTLREMIDSNQRLFVMAERDGGDPSWYRRQFDITQETPFSFDDPEQLEKKSSCKPNRGPDDAPFFLMNNWIDTSPAPKPGNAKVVNQKQFLLDRVELCTEVRGVEPKILAVDFYEQGDVTGAVDELNGVGADEGDD